ncbi:hypothetical protein E5358_14915, partial [Palleniella muris]
VSPYVYCANNPVINIDPDGRKIVLTGTQEQRIAVLIELQKLTNDKLGVRRYDGAVIIMAHGTKNTDMELSTGTSLIYELVNHDRTVEIMQGDAYHEHPVYRRDAFNGKGTDTEVYYSFDTDVTTIVQNRKTGKSVSEVIPRHIALGHELIHGHRSLNGVAKDPDLKMKYSYTDIDGYIYEANEKIEELETTGLSGNYKFTENDLREEEKLRKRIKY